MKIVIALGGNALLQRGEPMTYENQHANIVTAAKSICTLTDEHTVVISHGNGPQVGLLALQAAAYTDVPAYPLDVLGAETQAMIGYTLEQEVRNHAPGRNVATFITLTEVDANDPAFQNPTKPIGPIYTEAEAKKLADEKGWSIAPDGTSFRRVVPSPKPKAILPIDDIKTLVDKGTLVVCAGGGGIPSVIEDGKVKGIEAVIDKDLAAAVLAAGLEADMLIIATDVDGLYLDWGTPEQRRVVEASPEELLKMEFAKGSMGPKVMGCINFVQASGKSAVIGSLADIEKIVRGEAGTLIKPGVELKTA